jgi:hypothetical protein
MQFPYKPPLLFARVTGKRHTIAGTVYFLEGLFFIEANTAGYREAAKERPCHGSGSKEQMKIFHGYGQPENKTGKFCIAVRLVFPAL